jgi:hypothetical protein
MPGVVGHGAGSWNQVAGIRYGKPKRPLNSPSEPENFKNTVVLFKSYNPVTSDISF